MRCRQCDVTYAIISKKAKMMDIVKKAVELKKQGLNNSQISRELGIRRQDLVVIFKYLKGINKELFDEFEKAIKEVEKLKRELQAKEELQDNKYELLYKAKQQEVEELQRRLNKIEDELKKVLDEKMKCQIDKTKLITECNKKIEANRRKLLQEKNEILEEKNETIRQLQQKLNRFKFSNCIFYKIALFVFVFLPLLIALIGAGYVYFVLKPKKKAVWWDTMQYTNDLSTAKTIEYCYFFGKDKKFCWVEEKGSK